MSMLSNPDIETAQHMADLQTYQKRLEITILDQRLQ